MAQATVSIPEEVIKPVVKAQVAASITAAMGDAGLLIEELVSNALEEKTNAKGRHSKVDRFNCYDRIEMLAKSAIQKMAEECVQQWIEDQKPKIQEQVKKALNRKQGVVARALVDGLVNVTKKGHGFTCTVSLGDCGYEDDDY